MRRRLSVLLLALLSSTVLLGVAAPSAFAHAALLTTTPGDAEILGSAPAKVTLSFSEPVGTSLGAVRVLTAEGDRVDTGDVTRSDGDKVVSVAVRPDIGEGTFAVVWRVVSADSHPVSGAFTFVVGAPSVDPKTLLGKGNLTDLSDAPRGPGALLGISRLVGFAALVVLLGGALFCLLLQPAATTGLRRLLLGAAAVEALAAGAALLLQGPYAAGLPVGDALNGDLLSSVLDSRYGVATATRVGLALAAVLAVVVLRARVLALVLTVLGTGWAVTWALAGHAGVGEWQPVTAVLDVVHLVAVSAWVGGLVLLVRGLRGRWDAATAKAVLPGWSRLATWSVVVLVGTGVFASIREVGDVGALFSTSYGRLLLVKSTSVGLMLLFALIGRSFVRQHYTAVHAADLPVADGPTDEDVAGLRRSVVIEAGLAALVLAVTAVLVNTTPAKAAFNPPYSGRSAAGPLTVQVDVYPARKGLNGVHVYTVGEGSRTVDVAEVTGSFVKGGDTITFEPRRKSLGHYEDLDVVLPSTGEWTVRLQVRVNDVDSYPTEQVLTVN